MSKEIKEELNYHKKLNTLVIFHNIISLVCFVILAILFNKWWIVFFSLLFRCFVSGDKDE